MRAACVMVVLAVAAGCGPREATFKVRPSVEQLQVTHAAPGSELVVVDAKGHEVQRGTVDERGSLMFR